VNRLRTQLILAFTLIVLVTVGAIAILIIRTTNTQFRQYITHSGMRASGSGLQLLIAHYQQEGSWEGVGSLLGQGVFMSGPGVVSVAADGRRPGRPGGQLDVVLSDANGRVVFDSTGKAEGRRLKSGEKSQALAIAQTDDEEVIGYLLLAFPGGMDRLGRLEQQFLDRMQQILIIGAVLAVGVGLAIGALLSRRLTAPLQRLAMASRAVAAGDLDAKVRVEGSAEMVDVGLAFNEMTATLGESERQRQNMVADVAHELRTPLAVLQGNLRAILDDVYPLDKAEIARVYDESRLLSRLVDDLRELALADAGQLRLHQRPMDLAQVVQTAVENLAPAAEVQGVTLSAQVPGDLPKVHGDPDRVAQVLRNLLVNALRHTPAGGSISVTVSLRDRVMEVAVADTGEGIAAEDLPHVFERFWRTDPARAREDRLTGGSGLGLSVAQSLVVAQGGRVWVESAPGQGSTFRFSLPTLKHAPGEREAEAGEV
jgi:two-component system OmpR family sensor kinase/two-component system sensor histidine kinase BaeS